MRMRMRMTMMIMMLTLLELSQEEDGRWRDTITGDTLDQQLWAPGFPLDWQSYDCAFFTGGQLVNQMCTALACPVCSMEVRDQTMVLRDTDIFGLVH